MRKAVSSLPLEGIYGSAGGGAVKINCNESSVGAGGWDKCQERCDTLQKEGCRSV